MTVLYPPTPHNSSEPDQLDEIRIRMGISNLEARLAMREIDIAVLDRQLGSPLTSSKKRAEASARREAEHEDWWQIKTELDELRRLYPHVARH